MARRLAFATVTALLFATACVETAYDPGLCYLCAPYDADAAISDVDGGSGAGGASGGTAGGTAGEPSFDAGPDGTVEAGCGALDACVPCDGNWGCPDQACDAERGVCVPCVADGTGCADDLGRPVCRKSSEDSSDNACVQCTQSIGQCDGATPACDTASGTCVPCLTGTDEGCSGAEPVCKAGDASSDNECVQCTPTDDDACTDDTPYCDDDNTCTGCLENAHCTEYDRARCNTLTGQCAPCQSSSPDCNGIEGAPVCKLPAGACVQCTAAEDDACSDTTPHCDTGSNSCVACTQNSHCPDIAAAHCGTGHTCVGCTGDADCTRFLDTPYCDESRGVCVECTLDTEATVCGAKSCRLSDGTCTDTDRGSVLPCRECEADSECLTGAYCVDQGGQFCFWDGASGCADTDGARRPYSTTSSTITSIDGYESTFCLPKAGVSCAAVVSTEIEKSCSVNADCAPTGQGGYCPETAEPRGDVCSYGCTENYDCKIGLSCPDAGLQYCQ